MSQILTKLDFEHLALAALESAKCSVSAESRNRRLNRAAAYAAQGEEAGNGPSQHVEVLNLIDALSAALDDADALGLTLTAIHINEAIIGLAGMESPPAVD